MDELRAVLGHVALEPHNQVIKSECRRTILRPSATGATPASILMARDARAHSRHQTASQSSSRIVTCARAVG
jgi:hypothetical protein